MIEKRLLWSAILGFVVIGGLVFLNITTQENGITGDNTIPETIIFTSLLYISYSALCYSILSLINVGHCFLTKRGMHNDIVGVIGGFLLGLGIEAFSLIIYMPITDEAINSIRLDSLAFVSVLIVVGLTLTVKG